MKPPTEKALAQQVRALADRLDQHGRTISERAELLASRGYPASTNNSGPRGSSELTSTEAAATRTDRYTDIDAKWNRTLCAAWKLTTGAILLIDSVMAHADPASSERRVRRPGAGTCGACTRDVAGTAEDRLRSGWCNACRMAWARADRPDRMAFERRRIAELAQPSEPVLVDPRV